MSSLHILNINTFAKLIQILVCTCGTEIKCGNQYEGLCPKQLQTFECYKNTEDLKWSSYWKQDKLIVCHNTGRPSKVDNI